MKRVRQNSSTSLMDEEINYFYDKKFSFQRPKDGWIIPPVETMFTTKLWEIPEMLKLKDELNAMKNKLNDFNLEKWHRHTWLNNISGNVIGVLKDSIDPELITQGWCKFYEILATYPLISQAAKTLGALNTVHLCEAPGAFVASLNHFLRLNYPELKLEWIATSLNPYYEENPLSSLMVNDDRFMLHTLDRWKFGRDYTGNIMDTENLKALVHESQKLGPILLVTADGSFDCQDRPDEQEQIVSQLIFCEVVCALHILSAGGCLVVKMFTMYEAPTICLMYFLNACFESVHVFKPVTSKEGNSENYVVCINYDGTNERKQCLRQLRTQYSIAIPNKCMFPLLEIPEDFIEQLLQCTERFKKYQEETLERNIMLFTVPQPTAIDRMKALKKRMANEYLNRYNIRALDSEADEVVGKSKLSYSKALQLGTKVLDHETYNERKRIEQLPPQQKLEHFLAVVSKVQSIWSGPAVNWIKLPHRSLDFKILEGKPINNVRSSKFCSGHLLNLNYNVKMLLREIQGKEKVKQWIGSCPELSEEISRCIKNYCPDLVLEKCHILNFKNELWSELYCGKNEEYERNAFLEIFEVLEGTWRDASIVIEGYPMLTQFTAGVVYMLGHLFEEVGILRPINGENALIFHKYRSRDHFMESFIKELETEAEKLLSVGGEKTVLSVIPITELVENSQFYGTIAASNVLSVRDQLCNSIRQALPKTTFSS